MEEYSRERGAHVLALPFPAQGHVTPMLQLSKRLVSKGLKVTLIIPSDKPTKPYKTQHGITFVNIAVGFQLDGERPDDLDDYVARVKRSVSKHLPALITESRFPPKALIYDSTMPWVLDIARKSCLYGVVLFTQPWMVNVIFYHVMKGAFHVPPTRDDDTTLASFPALPFLLPNDLPSFVSESSSYPTIQRVVVDQISNIHQVDLVLCNTFDKLEDKVLKWVETIWPVKNIGPTVPSMYLDKRVSEDKDYGISMFDPELEECRSWLDTKQPSSVVYVSFGSLATLNEEQMHELAEGLKQADHFFLWVVRETETSKLPMNYLKEISEKGFIVSWSPQLEVLEHKSIGCFVTHCGWNSCLEALSLGVPMIGMPVWADQPTNAKFIEDVWKVGNRVKVDKNGMVAKEEIVRCVHEVMEGEKGKEIRRNSGKWKDLAVEAVSDGGTSDKHLDEFVADLCRFEIK